MNPPTPTIPSISEHVYAIRTALDSKSVAEQLGQLIQQSTNIQDTIAIILATINNQTGGNSAEINKLLYTIVTILQALQTTLGSSTNGQTAISMLTSIMNVLGDGSTSISDVLKAITAGNATIVQAIASSNNSIVNGLNTANANISNVATNMQSAQAAISGLVQSVQGLQSLIQAFQTDVDSKLDTLLNEIGTGQAYPPAPIQPTPPVPVPPPTNPITPPPTPIDPTPVPPVPAPIDPTPVPPTPPIVPVAPIVAASQVYNPPQDRFALLREYIARRQHL